ncbi:MAG: hypothetical protein JO257_11470 [Deltaproteobacteria bacterium]|nr:hypothetical protein [Deltaproteobacteria bacterium]
MAETQADIAARENDEGKQLMFQQKYADASAKFRDAAARTNEGKYYFNLCTSLYQEGKFGEAMTACNTADKNAPDDKLKEKVAKLREKIQTDAKAANVDVSGVGTGGGGGPTDLGNPVGPDGGNGTPPPNGGNGTPPPNGGGPGPGPGAPGMGAVAPPPQQALFIAKKPEHNYSWALGGEFFGGGGKIGQPDYYGSSAFGVRFHGDYLVKPASKIGVQGYLQITNFTAGSMQNPNVSTLDDFDLGVAGYKHICPIGGHLCFTPLVGVHLAFMSPAGMTDGAGSQVFNYTAAGGRLELALSYAFGSRFENVISAMVGANLYTKVFASPSDPSQGLPADQIGLDAGGAIGYFGLGYTRRFDTPFGQTPFVTLE